MNEVFEEYDPQANLIFQYNFSQIEKIPSWLNTVSSNSQNFGLAMGQSIFWELWQKYIIGNVEDEQVISAVQERFQKFLNLWSD